MLEALDYTGERMVPEGADAATFWEHVYRYRFASHFVAGKRVLDVACGEGYGAAALARAGATSLIGLDVSPEACEHARRKYGVDAQVGDAQGMNLPSGSIDVITSFETIEHVARPQEMLAECRRVLTPGGCLIISTPDREEYAASGSFSPFHCSELTGPEFARLLQTHFPVCRFYGQSSRIGNWWSIYSIAAQSSPWLRLKGMGRVREAIRRIGCGHPSSRVDPKHRESVIELILARDKFLSNYVNPFGIWPASRLRQHPIYHIAVAWKTESDSRGDDVDPV